jgi:hypothetical protein
MLNYAKTHVFYVLLIIVGLIAFRCWLSEHDARVAADNAAKVAEANVAALRSQIAASDAAAAQTIAALKDAARRVKTPEQAIAAIPDVSSLPLHATAAPTPGFVQVDALNLYTELNECKQDKTALDACVTARSADEAIIVQKDNEIVALKKKPSFFKRLGSVFKQVGVGIGIGFALGHRF